MEGCAHGELDRLYKEILTNETTTSQRVDLVLLCGDIQVSPSLLDSLAANKQAIRNEADLDSLSVPNKYKKLGDFHKYYAGEKKAPILTLVIGGNHEASNFMWELYARIFAELMD